MIGAKVNVKITINTVINFDVEVNADDMCEEEYMLIT